MSPNFKVLHVIETLGRGGAEQVLLTMLPELVRQGVAAEVAVQRAPLDLAADLRSLGIPVHVLPKRHKWALWGAARDLTRLALEREVQVIHAHLYFPTIIAGLARWSKLFGGTTFASFHNLAYSGANAKGFKLAVRRVLAAAIVRHGIDQPQAVSQASANHFAETYGLENVAVVHNAIDLEKIKAPDADAPDKNSAAIVLPGRLVPEKGHLDLIAALRLLKNSYSEVIFAGDGPLRMRLEEEIRAAGLPIRITGQLEHSEMLATMAAARLVVIPSRYEGFGLTALEALALGRPVVASTAGGLPEVLGDLGQQVSPGVPYALAEALDAALIDPDWAHAQETAGPVRAEKFAASAIAAHQISLYRKTHVLRKRSK